MRIGMLAPLGFLIGISLGALGGGGSILAVPVLVFVAEQPPAVATTTSLMVVGAASLVGAYGHWRSGRVRVAPGLLFGAVGVAGSFAGASLSRRVDGDVLLLAFAALILVAAWRIVAGCPSCTRTGDADAIDGWHGGTVVTSVRTLSVGRLAGFIGAGTSVGFLTGLFGIGGGFVIVPTLALVLEFSMPAAIGTSLLVISVNSAAALAARAGAGTVDWASTLLFAAAAVAGVGYGKRMADRLEPAGMQRGFASVLVAVGLLTGARALAGIL